MEVTLLGMVIDANEVQKEKAHSPMEVTPSEIITSVREDGIWPPNRFHIEVTEAGNVKDRREVQSPKTFMPMEVTLTGMEIDANEVQL